MSVWQLAIVCSIKTCEVKTNKLFKFNIQKYTWLFSKYWQLCYAIQVSFIIYCFMTSQHLAGDNKAGGEWFGQNDERMRLRNSWRGQICQFAFKRTERVGRWQHTFHHGLWITGLLLYLLNNVCILCEMHFVVAH